MLALLALGAGCDHVYTLRIEGRVEDKSSGAGIGDAMVSLLLHGALMGGDRSQPESCDGWSRRRNTGSASWPSA